MTEQTGSPVPRKILGEEDIRGLPDTVQHRRADLGETSSTNHSQGNTLPTNVISVDGKGSPVQKDTPRTSSFAAPSQTISEDWLRRIGNMCQAADNDNISIHAIVEYDGYGRDNSHNYNFLCNYCASYFHSQKDLLIHMEKHVFVCSCCEYRSFQRYKVIRHSLNSHASSSDRYSNMRTLKFDTNTLNKNTNSAEIANMDDIVKLQPLSLVGLEKNETSPLSQEINQVCSTSSNSKEPTPSVSISSKEEKTSQSDNNHPGSSPDELKSSPGNLPDVIKTLTPDDCKSPDMCKASTNDHTSPDMIELLTSDHCPPDEIKPSPDDRNSPDVIKTLTPNDCKYPDMCKPSTNDRESPDMIELLTPDHCPSPDEIKPSPDDQNSPSVIEILTPDDCKSPDMCKHSLDDRKSPDMIELLTPDDCPSPGEIKPSPDDWNVPEVIDILRPDDCKSPDVCKPSPNDRKSPDVTELLTSDDCKSLDECKSSSNYHKSSELFESSAPCDSKSSNAFEPSASETPKSPKDEVILSLDALRNFHVSEHTAFYTVNEEASPVGNIASLINHNQTSKTSDLANSKVLEKSASLEMLEFPSSQDQILHSQSTDLAENIEILPRAQEPYGQTLKSEAVTRTNSFLTLPDFRPQKQEINKPEISAPKAKRCLPTKSEGENEDFYHALSLDLQSSNMLASSLLTDDSIFTRAVTPIKVAKDVDMEAADVSEFAMDCRKRGSIEPDAASQYLESAAGVRSYTQLPTCFVILENITGTPYMPANVTDRVNLNAAADQLQVSAAISDTTPVGLPWQWHAQCVQRTEHRASVDTTLADMTQHLKTTLTPSQEDMTSISSKGGDGDLKPSGVEGSRLQDDQNGGDDESCILVCHYCCKPGKTIFEIKNHVKRCHQGRRIIVRVRYLFWRVTHIFTFHGTEPI